MAQLALEYIIRLIILVVVALVIISLILTFQQNIVTFWDGFANPPTTFPNAVVIERTSFTSTGVANFIEGCWSSNEGSQEDNECYFLLGDVSTVDPLTVISSINPDIIAPNKVVFDVTSMTDALIISYDNYRGDVGSAAIVIKGR